MIAPVVEAIRDRGTSIFVVATGAGAGLQQMLWLVPGISRVLVGAAFPYAQAETDELLGFRPASYCSRGTAIELAMAAFMRAKAGGGARPAVGLAITASVASNVAHRSDHRIHAAAVSDTGCLAWDRVLAKGTGEFARMDDGESADRLGLDLLALAVLGTQPRSTREGDTGPDDVHDPAAELFWRRPLFLADGRRAEGLPPGPAVLFPGTFNPLHDGHRAMAAQAQQLSDRQVFYAVNADSIHKPALSTSELLSRAAAIRGEKWSGVGSPVLFTRGEPLFVDKARARPGTTFVIGADALARMLDPKWGVDAREVLTTLAVNAARFYVFARQEGGQLLTAGSVLDAMPFNASSFKPLFQEAPGIWAVSSTEIRARGARA